MIKQQVEQNNNKNEANDISFDGAIINIGTEQPQKPGKYNVTQSAS